MNASNMLLRALESGDTSDATLSAALDALRETGALSLLGAMREALHSVDAGIEARQIASACSCIEVGAPHRDRLLLECRSLACVSTDDSSTVFIQPGDGAPSAFRSPVPGTLNDWGAWQIFVGALWLLQRDAELTAQHRAHSRRLPQAILSGRFGSKKGGTKK